VTAAARPRLLFVSPRFLFPADEGGKIRSGNILRCMKGGAFEIILASPAPADFARHAEAIDAACDRFVHWPEARRGRLRRLLSLADPLPVSVAGDRSAEGTRVLSDLLAAGIDLVVVDFPHAAVLVPDLRATPSVLFTHNVEAEILERHAAVATGLWRRVWTSQARKMRAFEREACGRFTSVIAVSERDSVLLAERYGLARVERIDTGVDVAFFAFSRPEDRPPPPPGGGTVVFTGAMDWAANIDGVRFLMEAVWPRVAAARPAARAVIVGRRPPASLVDQARAAGVAFTFTGFVDDVRPYVADADLSVIPLRVGSGTRIKAFEAMALGRPVVSTRVGVEGLGITEGEHFLAADTPDDFADAILRLLGDDALRHRLAAAARHLVEQRFTWDKVAAQFEAICARALAAHAEAARAA